MQTFRILHVSDFHFGSRDTASRWRRTLNAQSVKWYKRFFGPPPSESIARQLAVFALARRERLDAVLITGDLATTGFGDDLDAAHEYVASPVAERARNVANRPTLQALSLPILLLPGNHDRFRDNELLARVGLGFLPGGKTFDAKFGKYWRARHGSECLEILLKGDESLAVVGADLTLPWHEPRLWKHFGQGRVRRHHRATLAELSSRLRGDGHAVVWSLHFPPSLPSERILLRLAHASRALEAARTARVVHVFCGHAHQPIQFEHVDPETGAAVRCYCAGSALQPKKGQQVNSVHIAEISVESGSVVDVGYESFVHVEGRFRPYSGALPSAYSKQGSPLLSVAEPVPPDSDIN